jgi:hypothetical protein
MKTKKPAVTLVNVRPAAGAGRAVTTAAAAALLLPLCLLRAPLAHARNLMSADGPGGTYELLRKAYTTELPDCGHMVPHITEEFDNELGKNVFIFHAHVNLDDDRCGGTDRQRTEIRAAAPDIVANNGETVYYRWKFKLDSAFQGNSKFTHIFQIKSDMGAPIMTLTPRTSTFGITGRVTGAPTTDLAKFKGTWVVVNLKVLFSDNGRVEITIRRISNGEVLYTHAGAADMWDANASGHDSKFGIYRSLLDKPAMRDEQVRFADFCASKQSAAECEDDSVPVSDGGAGGASGDAGGGDDASGGSNAGSGGDSGSGGSNTGSGGSGTGSGGTSTPGSGGASGAGGAPGTGGRAPSDAAGPRDSRPPSQPDAPDSNVSGCACALGVGGHPAPASAGWLLLLGALVVVRRSLRRRG